MCLTCSMTWTYTASDQSFIARKGFSEPKTCHPCRDKRKEAGSKYNASTYTGSRNVSKECYKSSGPYGSDGPRYVNDTSEIDDHRSFSDPSRDSSIPRQSYSLPNSSSEISRGMKRKPDYVAPETRESDSIKRHRGEKQPLETDRQRIEQRLKQIQYGYATSAYDRYIAAIPKDKRGSAEEHPRTPDPYVAQSKRAFDGRLHKWRRELHKWDVNGADGEMPSFLNPKHEKSKPTAPQELAVRDCAHKVARLTIASEVIDPYCGELLGVDNGNVDAPFSDDGDDDADVL